MTDMIIIAIVLVVVGAAAFYLYRAKKRGVKCVGCPSGCNCQQSAGAFGCGGCCGCHVDDNE